MDRRFQYVRKRLMRCILPGLRQLPPAVSSEIVAAFGPMEYVINADLRRRYHDVLGRAADHFGSSWPIPQLARRLSANLARWMTRDLLLDGWSDATVEPLFQVEGQAHLDNALAEGRGALLLFSHFGAHVHPTHWLMRHGYTVRWFTERPKLLSRLITRDFETDGPTGQRKMFISRKASPSEAAASLRRAQRALDAGMIVKVAGDVRWAGPRTVQGSFLGRRYTFTTPWITLASLSGRPVVPVFCTMEPGGRFAIGFEEPLRLPPEARLPDQAEPWLATYLERLEARVGRSPENSNEYFFWYESTDFVVSATAADAGAAGRKAGV